VVVYLQEQSLSTGNSFSMREREGEGDTFTNLGETCGLPNEDGRRELLIEGREACEFT